MPEVKIVKLSDPFEHHGKIIDSIELREPSGGLYSQLGDPRIAVRNAEGGYWVEKDDTVKRYLDRCIVHQDGATLLGLMSIVDVMKIKEELFRFFALAEGKIIAERAASLSSAVIAQVDWAGMGSRSAGSGRIFGSTTALRCESRVS